MITNGEIIQLSNNKEYICVSTLMHNGKQYMLLMSNFKPIEIKFGEQTINNGEISIRMVNNQDEKLLLMDLFKDIKLEQ